MTMHRTFCSLVLICAIGLLAPRPATAVIAIDTVPVGNPGNVADTTVMIDGSSGYGSVGYAYNIGKYEVTLGQYTTFLNAVAATDTYGLYNAMMTSDLRIAGILQSGNSGSYSYSVIGSANHPVTHVSWGDAARFANWLHNNQPTGLQGLTTTEDGTYFLNGANTAAALNASTRKAGAQWFIPSENEWYKAAYHKNDGATSNYWSYPTGTNSEPYSDQPPGSGAPTQSNTANYYRDDEIANGYNDGYAVSGSTNLPSGNALTDAGAYISATSPYGTFDQGGNVTEWIEALGSVRGLRGGSWGNSSGDSQQSSNRSSYDALFGNGYVGFRVATVPEPSTGVLGVIACGLMWWWRKRFK